MNLWWVIPSRTGSKSRFTGRSEWTVRRNYFKSVGFVTQFAFRLLALNYSLFYSRNKQLIISTLCRPWSKNVNPKLILLELVSSYYLVILLLAGNGINTRRTPINEWVHLNCYRKTNQYSYIQLDYRLSKQKPTIIINSS